jgi:hypothetical protein
MTSDIDLEERDQYVKFGDLIFLLSTESNSYFYGDG